MDTDKGRLVLSRRPGEAIEIGPDVKVTVLARSSSGAMRLAIEAPRALEIRRVEREPRDA